MSYHYTLYKDLRGLNLKRIDITRIKWNRSINFGKVKFNSETKTDSEWINISEKKGEKWKLI